MKESKEQGNPEQAKKREVQPEQDDDFQALDEVPWDLSVGDNPGVFLEYADDNLCIHGSLGNAAVLPAGLMQGTTPPASRTNLKNW